MRLALFIVDRYGWKWLATTDNATTLRKKMAEHLEQGKAIELRATGQPFGRRDITA